MCHPLKSRKKLSKLLKRMLRHMLLLIAAQQSHSQVLLLYKKGSLGFSPVLYEVHIST